jgi:hypothetical protein
MPIISIVTDLLRINSLLSTILPSWIAPGVTKLDLSIFLNDFLSGTYFWVSISF